MFLNLLDIICFLENLICNELASANFFSVRQVWFWLLFLFVSESSFSRLHFDSVDTSPNYVSIMQILFTFLYFCSRPHF